MFKQTGLLKDIPDPRRSQEEEPLSFPKLGKADFDSLSGVFKRVYPNIYEGLENFWVNSRKAQLDIHTTLARADESCDHKWDETFIYKYNKSLCYLCRNCHLLVGSPVNKTDPKERKRAAGPWQQTKK